ncbi:hypothetical protein ACFL9T_06825 [Thermodesulfobacteriota bacterium]
MIDIDKEKPTSEENSVAEDGTRKEDSGPTWEQDLDIYPLREASEDPRWAIRTVWIWLVIALSSLTFILTLLVLGAIYD